MSSHKTTFTGLGLALFSLSALLICLSFATGHFYTKCESVLKEKAYWENKAIIELEHRKDNEFLLDSANQLLQNRSEDLNRCQGNYRSMRRSVDSLRLENFGLQNSLGRAERAKIALLKAGKSCADNNAKLMQRIVTQPTLFAAQRSRLAGKTNGKTKLVPVPIAQNEDPPTAFSVSPGGKAAGILLIGFWVTFLASGIAARVTRYRNRRNLRKRAIRTP